MKLFHIVSFLLIANILSAQNSIFLKEHIIPNDEIKSYSQKFLNESQVLKLYNHFDSLSLFEWDTDPNNCEDRANSVSILLDSWEIINYKVWIFSGDFVKKDKGKLICMHKVCWKYHVASVIPFFKNGELTFIVIDPSTTKKALELNSWTEIVTRKPNSYYFLTKSDKYIFKRKRKRIFKRKIKINDITFVKRNNTNYEYTIQGLAGFNGLNRNHRKIMKTPSGKKKLADTKKEFEILKRFKPNLD